MKAIKVDLVIPVLDGYNELKYLLSVFKTQENIEIDNIVVPITIAKDINIFNKIKQLCEDNKILTFEINREDFSHSLVREKAIRECCKNDVVILLTDDIKINDSLAMYNLAKEVIDGDVVYAFGRQMCSRRTIEHYIREYNYPTFSYIVSEEDIEAKQIKAFFASDVFAAINRKVFLKLGGYNGLKLPTNEDMYYMYVLLTNGYKAKYCADAMVEHYHSLTPKKLYKRYYDAGKFFKIVKVFDKYNKNGSGKSLAFYILKEAFKHFDIITIIRWPFNIAIRFIGMKRGTKAKI